MATPTPQKPELKYCVIARFQTGKIINCAGDNSSSEKQYKGEAEKLLAKLMNSKFHPSERQKINSSSGNWFATMDDKEIMYLVLTNQTYAERHAYGLIGEIIAELEKSGDYSAEADASIKFITKNCLKELFPKYQDTKSFDKIQQAQENVDQVRVTMNKNISSALNNQQSLRKVEEGSINLNKQANVFAKQAKDLERIMYWRKIKINVILGLVILAVLCFIILPIVFETTAINGVKNGIKNGGGGGDIPPNPQPEPEPQPGDGGVDNGGQEPINQPTSLHSLHESLQKLENNEQQMRRQLYQDLAYTNKSFLGKQN